MEKIDVIIPVYKPTEHLLTLFYMLDRQSVRPNKVIVINTEEKYWNKFFGTYDVLSRYPFIELHHIEKKEFNHGDTRNYGVSLSDTDLFLMMTQDAVPKDEHLLENLSKNFNDPKVGISYARQIPHKGCGVIESYTRQFNYPPVRIVKGMSDIKTLGIKAFYASNVCSMYRKNVFERIGGFTRTDFNEDMIYARRMIEEGLNIVYEPSAIVCHSHDYTGVEQFKRNFALGVSHATHPEIFSDVRSESEGIKLVKSTTKYLLKRCMPFHVIKLVYHSGMKYLGYRMGVKSVR
ncbi:MAG: glycosyltransferase family 2 protein [Lachnospiraceae bacterium]|nr:glycosyltransferase family 2 protein [Lachnospiraceae bacterium]